MRLVITRRAANDLRDIADRHVSDDILRRMTAIAANPFASHQNVERLQGLNNAWRLRKGDRRALYTVDRERETVTLERVMHRREVYR
jgi:mRNA-degrading endonuclease RelE of RelBE toxin-antitoxin system